MDNRSMEPPTQVTIGVKNTNNTTESTAVPTQVTICAMHAHNSTDTDTRKLRGGKCHIKRR